MLANGSVVVDEVTLRAAPRPPRKIPCFVLTLQTPPLSCARGSCRLQTDVIALNRSRSLRAFGRGDAIAGVAAVAWESRGILGLTFPAPKST